MFTVVSSTEIKTNVPSGATTGKVKVKTPRGTLTSNVNFRVTPTIVSFLPTSGPVVVITGESFTGDLGGQVHPAPSFGIRPDVRP